MPAPRTFDSGVARPKCPDSGYPASRGLTPPAVIQKDPFEVFEPSAVDRLPVRASVKELRYGFVQRSQEAGDQEHRRYCRPDQPAAPQVRAENAAVLRRLPRRLRYSRLADDHRAGGSVWADR